MNLQNHISLIKKAGYTKIKNFLTKGEVEKILKLTKIYYKKNIRKYRGVPSRDTSDKIIYNLQNKNFEFINLVTKQKVLKIAQYFLNDKYYRFLPSKKPNFILSYLNARSSGSKLDLHIDSHIPFKGKKPYMMQFAFLLEKSTRENGCTTVVDKSHQSGKYCNRSSRKIKYLEGKPGDLLIWDSRLWHGTCSNKSLSTRWSIICTFSMWFIKQSMDIPSGLPNKIYSQCSNMQKQILGFCSIPPSQEKDRINTKSGYKILNSKNSYFKK